MSVLRILPEFDGIAIGVGYPSKNALFVGF